MRVGEEHVGSIVSACLGRLAGFSGFDVYVFDVGAGAGSSVAGVLGVCDLAVVVVEDTRPGVVDALRVLGIVRRLGLGCVVVVNKARGGPAARRGFGGLAVVEVPYEWSVAAASVDAGEPVVCMAPGSGVARGLARLAGIVAGLAAR